MAYTLDNFVRSVLSAAAAATDTTLTLAAAAAPLRNPPNASVGSPGVLVLQDLPASPTKIEVVTYTGASLAGTVLTLTGVTRAKEGTTAQAWPAATPTFGGLTAAVVADMQSQLTAKLDATATAAAATKLATARTINGTAFDGTANITVPANAEWGYAASDETTALTTGTKVTDRAPMAMTLSKVKASLTTASTSGVVKVDVQKNGVSIFSTLITIDATEKTTATAAIPAVLAATPTAIADDDEITISISTAGTGAAGLKVHLIGTV